MASIGNEGLLQDSDLWIFTAKQEELNKVLSKFRNSRDRGVTMDDDEIIRIGGSRYYPGKIRLLNGSFCRFAITSGYRQGPQSFGIFASRVLTAHPVDYALMVGICAGDPAKEVKLKDVIFACKSFNYEEGKRRDGGLYGQEEFDPEYEPYKTAEGVENEVTDFVSKQTRGDYKKSPMISGASVQENAARIFKQCQKGTNRKIAALDMESSAFFEACNHCGVKALPVIKAVSDAGDKTKSDSHHGEALEKAAHAAICFVEHFFQVVGCHASTASKDKTGIEGSRSPVTGLEVKKRKGMPRNVGESVDVAARPPENISEPVSGKLMNALSDRLGEDWENLAYELGFEFPQINNITKENDSNRKRAKGMLQCWKTREGERATKQTLVDALKRAKLGLFADYVRGYTN